MKPGRVATDVGAMNKLLVLLPVIAVLLVADRLAFAKSARTIHSELVGVATVALNFSPQNLPGLDTYAVELDIRNTLKKAGIRIEQTAPVTLFVRVTYQQIPACPEFIAFPRVRCAVRRCRSSPRKAYGDRLRRYLARE